MKLKIFQFLILIILTVTVSACNSTATNSAPATEISTRINPTDPIATETVPLVTSTSPATPLPTATTVTLPKTPAPTATIEASPTSNPLLLQPIGPGTELLLPQMRGMVFWQDIDLFQISDAGQFLPYTQPKTRWTNQVWAVENIDGADLNFSARELELSIHSLVNAEGHSVTVPNAGAVEVYAFLGPESDWALVGVAHGDIYWDGWLPQTGLLNVRDGRYTFLGGAASARPDTQTVIHRTIPSLTGSYEDDMGFAIYDLESEGSMPLKLSEYGLNLDQNYYGLPTWSQDGAHLLLVGFWQREGCAEASGLIVLNFDEFSSQLLPIRYDDALGYLHTPQQFGNDWLWTGALDGQFGAWHFTLAGEIINFYENGIFPTAFTDTTIVYQEENVGWNIHDVAQNRQVTVEFLPRLAANGRDVWGVTLAPTTTAIGYQNWWFDLVTFELCEVHLPAGARLFLQDVSQFSIDDTAERASCSS